MSVNAVELRSVSKSFGRVRDGEAAVNAIKDIDLQIRNGEFFTLLGPSGCGKTTTLRLIAGFELPSGGDILIHGQQVADVPAHLRPVNTVFQSYALFPHLTVADNVAFGLSVKGVPKPERQQRVADALKLVQMGHMASRKPSELSGGQQQRVALARALINRPQVLLLDEPFGALDLKLRKEMQIELKHMQRQLGITFVFVTHDQEEALTMSDRIAVMHQGKVLQVDDPVGIYERPTTRFGAGFIGEMNFLEAKVAAVGPEWIDLDHANHRLAAPVPPAAVAAGQPVTIAIRPEALSFQALESAQARQIEFRGRVREEIYIGTDRRYVVDLASGEAIVARVQNAFDGAAAAPRIGAECALHCCIRDLRVLSE
ncbi:MAG TPA: ABC transporter ATP-binding protein [Terriglobales bacterium]|nr:ABC transporter ATP-binding protein [Terriglobales bacterium]